MNTNNQLTAQHQAYLEFASTHSKFVADILQRYPQALTLLTEMGLSQPLPPEKNLSENLATQIEQCSNETEQLAVLRQFRHLHMTHITIRDYNALQPIEASLEQVTALANVLIRQAYACAYSHFAKRYGTPMGEHGPQHLYMLGMGKLGGGELNFSSDIDLIFTYPASGEFSERRKPLEYQEFFIKVAQKTIYLLDSNTVDGQVFRVDMRLRPFGDSGPLVLPFSAIEDYYQQQGRSWERFAMLKARIINPADAYSIELAKILRPFIYRRYVDFSVIEALRDLKLRIVQENRRLQRKDNIKLGSGGIREVEFLAQSFQLIYGGRVKALQSPSLFNALAVISAEGFMPAEDVEAIKQAYLVLRKVEHCLQQYNNAQTQTLPSQALPQAALLAVCGPLYNCTDYLQLQAFIAAQMTVVKRAFTALIRNEEDELDQVESEQVWQDLWRVTQAPADLHMTLQQASPHTELPQAFFDALHTLQTQRQQWPLGDRGEAILNKLMPLFLADIASDFPEYSHACLDALGQIITAVSSRTTYLELMYENAQVRQQLLRFCGISDWVIQRILAYPVLLDELIHPQYVQRTQHDIHTWRNEFEHELQQALLRVEPDDHELQIHTLRQYKLAQHFRIAAADILDYLPIAQVSDKLTLLAETILTQVVQHAWEQITAKFGCPPNTSAQNMGLGIIGYGKLGGWELSYSSDLDIVVVHNQSPQGQTDGNKSISTTEFYVKLVQRIMHLCTTATLLGDLYEVDLRLRPSGNSGLLVTHITTYRDYLANDAWTWELQALVRTRMIFGAADIQNEFKYIRTSQLTQKRQLTELRQEIVNMRDKMRTHLGEKDKGALADIEFLTQYWCLAYSSQCPELIAYSDNLRQLAALGKAGLITPSNEQLLTESYLTLRHHQHHKNLQRATVHSPKKIADIAQRVHSLWQRILLDGAD